MIQRNIRKILLSISFLFIILGLGLILYPMFCNKQYEIIVKKQQKGMQEENTKQENISIVESLYNLLQDYNKEIYENNQINLKDPFSYSYASLDLTPYGIKDNIIAYIEIPKINVFIPIYIGASNENLDKGITLLTNTSYPIGGLNTNAVLAGHRGHRILNMFKDLDKLQEGDYIYIHNFKEDLIYEVSGTEIIEPYEINKLFIREGKDMISLITCHPVFIGDKRYIVYANRV